MKKLFFLLLLLSNSTYSQTKNNSFTKKASLKNNFDRTVLTNTAYDSIHLSNETKPYLLKRYATLITETMIQVIDTVTISRLRKKAGK